MLLPRRGFALGAAALVLGCQPRGEASPERTAQMGRALDAPVGSPGATRLLEWDFPGAMSTRSTVLVPAWGDPAARYPVLVALHGRGEALRPPAEGALGWPRDYALARAIQRVASPPLTSTDFEGFVEPSRLAYLNGLLARRPFAGLIVACPYVPSLDLADEQEVLRFGRFVKETLLPRVRRETRALADAASTGIDGVSLGGTLSLAIGLDGSSTFGAVGTLQPAVDAGDASRWADKALAARHANPKLRLRLLTSDGDYFREAVRQTSSAWSAAGVAHDFDMVLGPHDYPFNRGPGAIEMLTWHDRALRS
jgi:hypothetical protein